MMRVSHDAVDQLRRSEFEHGLHFALVFSALTVFAAIITLMAAWALDPLNVATWVTVVFIVGGVLVGVVLLWSFRRGQQFVSRWFAEQLAWSKLQREIEDAKAFPEIPAAKEPETPKPPITSGVSQPELIGGIDVEDLRLLCRYITRRGKWTAEVLEGFELPASHIIITNKDTRDGKGNTQATTYARIMKLFEPVIEGRGPGVTGTLTESDPDELLRKIRKIGTQQGQP